MKKRFLAVALAVFMLMSMVVVTSTGVAANVPDFRRITLLEGTTDVFVDGAWEANLLPATPFMSDYELMVPVDAFGVGWEAGVEWIVNGNAVTVQYGNNTAALTVGNTEMVIGTRTVEVPAPVQEGGVVFVPITIIADELGMEYAFGNGVDAVVIITGVGIRPAHVHANQVNSQREYWFGSSESLRIVENLLLWQRHCGGWAQWDRAPQWTEQQMTPQLRERLALQWHNNDASLDNNNFLHELPFLINMYQATGIPRYLESFTAAVHSVINGQYDHGGLPQDLDRPSSYHGEITFNDNVMVNIMGLWRDFLRNDDGAFWAIDDELRAYIQDSFDRALRLVLDLQVFSELNQMYTGWGAQHYRDYPHGLAWARHYEPPSISGSEGARVAELLITLDPVVDNLDAETWERIKSAIHYSAAFFAFTEMVGFTTIDPNRTLIRTTGNPLSAAMWPRFICPETFLPMFAYNNVLVNNSFDRYEFDAIYSYERISLSRRTGYHFFNARPFHLRTWRNTPNYPDIFDPEAYGRWLERNDEQPWFEFILPFRTYDAPNLDPGQEFNLGELAVARNPHNWNGLWNINWTIVDDGGTGAQITVNEEDTTSNRSTLTTANDGILTLRAEIDLTMFMPIREVLGTEFIIPVGDVQVEEPDPTPAPTPTPDVMDEDEDDESNNMWVIIAVAGGAGVVAIAIGAVVVMKKK